MDLYFMVLFWSPWRCFGFGCARLAGIFGIRWMILASLVRLCMALVSWVASWQAAVMAWFV